jgi:pimeloyl-ACP methyl ester carboxylesterase
LNIPKAFLCGYSTGGSIVLEFLLTFPDRSLGGIVISGMSEVGDWYLKNRISLAVILSKAGYANLLHEKLPCNKLEFLRNEKHQIPTKAAKELNQLINQYINSLCK